MTDQTKSTSEPSKETVRVAIYSRLDEADRAVLMLHEAGFRRDQISVICSSCSTQNLENHHEMPPSGAATTDGAVGGGAIGAVLGGLAAVAGIAATGGSLLVAGALLPAAGGGAVIGGYIGAMLSRAGENESTDFYDQAVRNGKVLVSVDAKGIDEEERLVVAENIIRESGAEPITLHRG